LLLAAATVAVAAAVDRGPQTDQLRALRTQGLTRPAAVVTGWAGTAALVFAVASAVAAPAYLLAVDRAVAAGQVAAAVPAERGLVISGLQNDRNQAVDETGRPGLGFTNVGAALASLPNFSYVYAAEYPTIDIEHDVRYRTRFT